MTSLRERRIQRAIDKRDNWKLLIGKSNWAHDPEGERRMQATLDRLEAKVARLTKGSK